MKKIALMIMIITMISKVVGFGREIVLSYFYGASSISDAYLIAITIPGVIFSFIATGLGAGYIPMYSKIIQSDGITEGNKFTSNLINILILLSTIIIILGTCFTEPLVKLFAAGFEGETLALAIKLTKISILAVYFSGLVSILTGFLQVKGNFVIPALLGMPLNFFIILAIFVSQYTSILVLAIGYVFAIGSQVIFMIPFMKSNMFKYSLTLKINDENISNLVRTIMPLILSVSVNQINILVDRTIASQVAIGGISALNFASRLNSFVQGIFVSSIIVALYPIISKLAADNKMVDLKKHLAEAITVINLLVIPATVGLIVFAKPIVTTLFGRGAFDEGAIKMTSSALLFYSIGMVGFGLRDIMTRAFYSLQDTKTPMINGVIGILINIVLNIILSRFLGIGGLALATSISAIVTTFLLFSSLRNKIGSFGLKQILVSFFKILFASIVMGVLAHLIFIHLDNTLNQSLSLLASIVIGGFFYFGLIFFMKIDDVDVIVNVFFKRIEKHF